MDDRHAAGVGEFPQVLGAAADADLDGALGIEDAREDGVAERPAMMEFCAFEGAACVAMGIDVHQPHGPLRAHGLQDRKGDGVVAADRERRHARCGYPGEVTLDVLDAVGQAVAAAKRHIADVAGLDRRQRQEAVHVMIGADALNPSHRPGSEARAGPIGDAQVHRDAGQRHIQAAEMVLLLRASGQNGAPRNVATPSYGFGRRSVPRRSSRWLLELGMMRGAGASLAYLARSVFELLAVHVRVLGAALWKTTRRCARIVMVS